MARARQRAEWDRAAALMTLVANANRDPKKKPSPYRIEDFHPLMDRRPRGIPIKAANIRDLKALLGGKDKP
jgi:hypothetical protein